MPVQQQAQPFSEYLDPAQVAPDNQRIRWDQGQQFSGWGGKAEAAAGLFSKFADGLSQGKLRAFQKNQQESANQLKIISAFTQSQMQRTDLSEAKKNDLLNWQNRAYAQILYPQVKEHTKAEGFGGHAAKAVSSIFGAMGGVNEAGKANPYGPDTFHGLLSAATADVEDPKHTIQAKIDEATKLWQAKGIADVNKRAELRGAVAPDMRDFQASPIASQVTGLYRQAGPQQLKDFMEGLPYPGAGDVKGIAGAGALAAVERNQQIEQGRAARPRTEIPPSATAPADYKAVTPPGAGALPPAQRVPVTPYWPAESRLSDLTADEKEQEQHNQQMVEHLMEIATGRPQRLVGQYDERGRPELDASGQQVMLTPEESRQRAEAVKRGELNNYRDKNYDLRVKVLASAQHYRDDSLEDKKKRTEYLGRLLNISQGRLNLENTKWDEPHQAIAAFFHENMQALHAESKQLHISDIYDTVGDLASSSSNPLVQKYAGVITNLVRTHPNRNDSAEQLLQGIFGGGAAAPAPEPAAVPPKTQAPGGVRSQGNTAADKLL